MHKKKIYIYTSKVDTVQAGALDPHEAKAETIEYRAGINMI